MSDVNLLGPSASTKIRLWWRGDARPRLGWNTRAVPRASFNITHLRACELFVLGFHKTYTRGEEPCPEMAAPQGTHAAD